LAIVGEVEEMEREVLVLALVVVVEGEEEEELLVLLGLVLPVDDDTAAVEMKVEAFEIEEERFLSEDTSGTLRLTLGLELVVE